MLESLLHGRFRCTTMTYDELLAAQENIIDKVTTVATGKQKKSDKSAPMHVGMDAKDDRDGAKVEGEQRMADIAAQEMCQAAGLKGIWRIGKGVSWNGRELWEKELAVEEIVPRTEQRLKVKVTTAIAAFAGTVARRYTLQRCARIVLGTRAFTPSMMTNPALSYMCAKIAKNCKHGVSWRQVRRISAQKCSADETREYLRNLRMRHF